MILTGDEKEKRVHDVFDNIYDHYDKMNSIISFKLHMKWRKKVNETMNIQPGSKVLDLCCGTGDWTFALSDAVGPTGQVTGLDFSEGMLSVAKKKSARHRLKNTSFIQGNAMDLPFPDNSFDYVTIGFGLRNVPDAKQVLGEMKRVVKPGGLITILETSQPENPFYKSLFWCYFKYIMPMLGKIFAKSYDEYSWLQESATDFPGMKTLAGWMEESGFKNVKYRSFSGGAAAVHFGWKPKN